MSDPHSQHIDAILMLRLPRDSRKKSRATSFWDGPLRIQGN